MRSQEKLLRGINRKDPMAWKELYRCFYGALCNYATRIIDDTGVAEDIVQECLISIWDSKLFFPKLKALSVYLYRSVYHNALKYLRDKVTDDQHLQKWCNEQTVIEENGYYEALEEELIRKLHETIARLPDQRKKILLLSIDGLSTRELADHLSVSINTVKTQKKRAYAYLKENMEQGFWLLFLLEILK